jgi:hypothetical protein
MNKENELFSGGIYEDIPQSNYWAYLGETGGIIADTNTYIERGISQKLLNYESINPVNLENKKDYLTDTENKTAHFDSNVISMRNFLFEIDDYSLEEQKIYAKDLIKRKIINRAVFSGNKSIHCRITINQEPKSKDIYKLAWHYFDKTYFDSKTDKLCSNPSRFTRRADYINQKTGKKQFLIYSSGTILPVSSFIDDIAKKYKAEKEKEEEKRILRIMNADNNNHNNNWKNYVKKAVEKDYDGSEGNRHELFHHISGCVFGRHNMNADYDEFVDYFNDCLDDPLSTDAIKALKHNGGYRKKLSKTEPQKQEPSVKDGRPILLYNVSKYTMGDILKRKKENAFNTAKIPHIEKAQQPVSILSIPSTQQPVDKPRQAINFVSAMSKSGKPPDNEPSYVECFLYGKNYLEELEKQMEAVNG